MLSFLIRYYVPVGTSPEDIMALSVAKVVRGVRMCVITYFVCPPLSGQIRHKKAMFFVIILCCSFSKRDNLADIRVLYFTIISLKCDVFFLE